MEKETKRQILFAPWNVLESGSNRELCTVDKFVDNKHGHAYIQRDEWIYKAIQHAGDINNLERRRYDSHRLDNHACNI